MATARVRLLAVPGEEPASVCFRLAFPVPDPESEPCCAPATLETGDGGTYDLGELCAPTLAGWREGRELAVANHTYAGGAEHTARLVWGETIATVQVTRAAEVPAGAAPRPAVKLLQVKQVKDHPYRRLIAAEVEPLAAGALLRLDGGAGQGFRLLPGEGPTEQVIEYPKPGTYTVMLDPIPFR